MPNLSIVQMRMATVVGAVAVSILAREAYSQFPRIAPPPPCRVAVGTERALTSLWESGRAQRSRPTVVVLPFERELDHPARAHEAWALSQRLNQRLGLDSRLVVPSAGSAARAFIETSGNPDSVAAHLGARFIVTGRYSADPVRQDVSVTLSRVGSETPVWRASFQTNWTLRGMEEAIVRGMTRALLGDSTPPSEPHAWPRNEAAHDALVAGDFHMLSITLAGADSARVMYERALAAEPGSALLMSRLARAMIVMVTRGGLPGGGSASDATNRIAAVVDRALKADSALSEAWTAKAMLARIADPVAFTGAAAAHRRAIALKVDDAGAHHEYGITLMRLGDTRAAAEEFRRAVALEPSRAGSLAALSDMAVREQRWQSACALANASIGAWPYDPMTYLVRAQARLRLSQARDAYADAEMARRLTGEAWASALRVIVANGANNVDAARRIARESTAVWLAEGRALTPLDAEYVARAYLTVGDRRRAIEALRRAQPIGADLARVIGSAALSPIRSDTTVARLLRQSRSRGID